MKYITQLLPSILVFSFTTFILSSCYKKKTPNFTDSAYTFSDQGCLFGMFDTILVNEEDKIEKIESINDQIFLFLNTNNSQKIARLKDDNSLEIITTDLASNEDIDRVVKIDNKVFLITEGNNNKVYEFSPTNLTTNLVLTNTNSNDKITDINFYNDELHYLVFDPSGSHLHNFESQDEIELELNFSDRFIEYNNELITSTIYINSSNPSKILRCNSESYDTIGFVYSKVNAFINFGQELLIHKSGEGDFSRIHNDTLKPYYNLYISKSITSIKKEESKLIVGTTEESTFSNIVNRIYILDSETTEVKEPCDALPLKESLIDLTFLKGFLYTLSKNVDTNQIILRKI